MATDLYEYSRDVRRNRGCVGLDEVQRSAEYAEAARQALSLQAWWKQTPWYEAEQVRPCRSNVRVLDFVYLEGGFRYSDFGRREILPTAQVGVILGVTTVVGGHQPYPMGRSSFNLKYRWGGDIGGHWFEKDHAEFARSKHYVWLPRLEQLIDMVGSEATEVLRSPNPYPDLLGMADAQMSRGCGESTPEEEGG